MFLRIETVEVMTSYTYNDYDDMFERSPLIVHIKDLTATRMYAIMFKYATVFFAIRAAQLYVLYMVCIILEKTL